MRRALSIVLCAIAAFLLSSFPIIAANNPGHDTLYVEEQGDSLLNGSLNITANLSILGRTDAGALMIYGDGTSPGSGTFIASSAGGTDLLRINTPGNLLLKSLGGGQVAIGGSTATDLNVTGAIYAYGNRAICLENGTGCPASALGGGNVTGSGSANYVPLWTSGTELGNSIIWANTTNVGIGTTAPSAPLHLYAGSSGVTGSPAIMILESNTHQYIGFQSAANTQQGIIFGHPGAFYYSAITWEDGARGNSLQIILPPAGAGTFNVNHDGVSDLFIDTVGKVGIGTTIPNQKLDVNGSINVSGGSRNIWIDNSRVCTEGNGLCASAGSAGGWTNTSTATSTALNVNVTAGNLTVPNGRIGIGTNAPAYTLDITGTLHATQNITADQSINVAGSGKVTFNNANRYITADGTKMTVGTDDPSEKLVLRANGADRVEIAPTGNVNVTSGNMTIQSTHSVCFTANCSARIYFNGTALIIEGQ